MSASDTSFTGAPRGFIEMTMLLWKNPMRMKEDQYEKLWEKDLASDRLEAVLASILSTRELPPAAL